MLRDFRQSTVSSVLLKVCFATISIMPFIYDGSIIKTNENRKGYSFRQVFFS
jgi:hypothetical protein